MEKCTRCKLGCEDKVKFNRFTCVSLEGAPIDDPTKIKVLVVSDQVFWEDQKAKRLFSGRDGWQLKRMFALLKEKGVDVESVAFTTAIRCPSEARRNVPKAALVECRSYLLNEIKELKPERIVCLGGLSARTLLEVPTFALEKNRRTKFDYEGIPVFVTYAPRYLFVQPAKIRAWAEDLMAYITGEIEPKSPDFDVRLINNPDHFKALKETYTGYEGKINFDMEWDVDSRKISLAGVQFKESPIYVLAVHHPESLLPGDEVVTWLQELFSSPKVIAVGLNLKADLSVLYPEGQPIYCLADDAMMWHYLLDENRASRSLAILAREFTEYAKVDDVDATQINSTPLNQAAIYNAIDVGLPPLIIEGIKKELESIGDYSPHMVEFNRRLIPFVACMESAGVAVDVAVLRDVLRAQTLRMEQLRAKLQKEAPCVKNLDSWLQLSAFLFGTKGGFTPEKLEEMGITSLELDVPDVKDNWGEQYASTSEHVLERLPADDGFVKALLEYRSAAKELRTYAVGTQRNLVLTNDPPGGRVYPDIFPATFDTGGGTVSGRISIKNPPMQTIDASMDIARTFVSRYGNDGFFLAPDGSQFELRWGTMESGDPFLTRMFVNKEDPHQINADAAEVGSRKEGKTLTFASIYGCSVKKLIELGVPPENAKIFKAWIEKNWATLYKFQNKVGLEILYQGVTKTPYGRVRRLPGAKNLWSKEVLQGINFRLQAPASDICQLLGYDIMVRGQGKLIPVLTNHDGLVFDVHKDDRTQALDTVRESVVHWRSLIEETLGVKITIPYEFTISLGPNLGELQEEYIFEC